MNKTRLSGQLNRVLIVPLLFLLLLIPVNIAVYFLDQGAGFLLTLALFAYLILAIIYYYRKRSTIKGEMITFAAQYGQIQKQLMMDFGLPYAVTEDWSVSAGFRLMYFDFDQHSDQMAVQGGNSYGTVRDHLKGDKAVVAPQSALIIQN